MNSGDVAQLYRNMGKPVPPEFHGEKQIRAHKYGARRKQIDGHMFDSTSEAQAYVVLKTWEQVGAIRRLELQPVYVLQEKQAGMRAIKYVGDFKFIEHRNFYLSEKKYAKTVVVDVKGIQTAAFRIKAKLFRAKFPDIDLQIWDRAKVKEVSRC